MGFAKLSRDVVGRPLRRMGTPLGERLADLSRSAMQWPTDLVGALANASSVHSPVLDIPHRGRRVWLKNGRAYIELREVDAEDSGRFVEMLISELEALDDVRWVDVHGRAGRVVVAFQEGQRDLERLLDTLSVVEAWCGVGGAPFGHHRAEHPADAQRMARHAIGLTADAAGLGLAATTRALRIPAVPFEVDAAALISIASYIPFLRTRIDRFSKAGTAEVGLGIARAISAGMAQSLGGPAFDVLHRYSILTGDLARYRAWERLEPELAEAPLDPDTDLPLIERATPLPEGPIEKLSRPAMVASMAGSAASLLVSRSVDRGISMLVAGSPKAAVWGREAMSSQLAKLLSERNILVMDPLVLDRFDRVDVVVIDSELLGRKDGRLKDLAPYAAELIAASRNAGLDVWLSGDASFAGRIEVRGVLGEGAELAGQLRRIQDEGHCVLYLSKGPSLGLRVADVGLGMRAPGRRVPWDAGLVGTEDIIDGYLVVEAIRTARVAARQTAHVALAGAGFGALMSFGGLLPGSTRRVMSATDMAALVAHANATRHGVELARRPLPEAPDETPYFAMSGEEVIEWLETTRQGLDTDIALSRLVAPPPQTLGSAALAKAIADEAINPLTPILAAGAGLSAATGSPTDALLVAGVMGFNALAGGIQRFRADRALASLISKETQRVRVSRGGKTKTIDADSLVPGDILHLSAGEAIPVDGRIVWSQGFEVDESSLTGESLPVHKRPESCAPGTPVADQTSMVFAGTTVAAGVADVVVVAVGRSTESYRGLLLAGPETPITGVEARLESITTMVTPASVLAGLGVFASGLLRGQPVVDVLSAGVSLAVAAVPEGLPLLATVAQQSAARRLSKVGVLVRNARAIEALGRVDVVCADKTGTLTEGRIRVACISNGTAVEEPKGYTSASKPIAEVALRATPQKGRAKKLPHPTDRAVARLAKRFEVDGWRSIHELPFEPRRGYHATLGDVAGEQRLAIKGAPEVVLPLCDEFNGEPLDYEGRRALQAHMEELGAEGLRVLAVAERDLPQPRQKARAEDVEGLRFLGFVGLSDPIRPASRRAIKDLVKAGVRVVMITGDHPSTAQGVARELELTEGRSGILVGSQIDAMTDEELSVALEEANVCARVTPAHKVRIVRAFQKLGLAVAMTGDGANDAPAIRLADVGIALGTRATSAARDASDLVITDDRIETIVAAVVEGRALWMSVRDATSILVGGNLGEIGFTLAGALVSGSAPLNARQLLLVNLATDVAPAMAIAVSPPLDISPEELLEEGPERSLGESLNRAIAVRALSTVFGTGGAWIAGRLTGRQKRASTIALAGLVGTELGQTLWAGRRSPLVVGSSLASGALLVGIVQTPGLSGAFGCTPLGPIGWAQAITSATAATVGSSVLEKWASSREWDFEAALEQLGRTQPEQRELKDLAAAI